MLLCNSLDPDNNTLDEEYEQQCEHSLMAGAMPPTEPGPGMFPATAAAWAAAAA